MSAGTDAARDLRYGRRGGGWQTTTSSDALRAIDRSRSSTKAWPDGSGRPPAGDTTRCSVCDIPYGQHTAGPCPVCGLPLEHHPDRRPTVDEWAARARMAAARRAAGQHLDRTDQEALRRHPEAVS